jgi:hypothetical protein
VTLGPRAYISSHTQSCISTIDRTLRVIECTLDRESCDLFLGYPFPFPHHFSPWAVYSIAPLTTLSQPNQLSPQLSQPLPTTTHGCSLATTCRRRPPPLTHLTIFFLFPIFTLCPSLPIFPKIFLLLTTTICVYRL